MKHKEWFVFRYIQSTPTFIIVIVFFLEHNETVINLCWNKINYSGFPQRNVLYLTHFFIQWTFWLNQIFIEIISSYLEMRLDTADLILDKRKTELEKASTSSDEPENVTTVVYLPYWSFLLKISVRVILNSLCWCTWKSTGTCLCALHVQYTLSPDSNIVQVMFLCCIIVPLCVIIVWLWCCVGWADLMWSQVWTATAGFVDSS